jgi:hypothetical protein
MLALRNARDQRGLLSVASPWNSDLNSRGVPISSRFLIQSLAICILLILLIAVVFRLSQFPGLHADEAWVGLRALEITQKGFFSVHGMNLHSGAAFPGLVSLAFSALGTNVFSLRLFGAILNWAAVALVMATFWRRGNAPFYAALLFASSLLFLFYSRVAWEVCAFENFAISLIIFAISRLFSADRPKFKDALLFFSAFGFATWNHFIFLGAVLSFGIISLVISFRDRNLLGARIFLLGTLNLAVPALLYFGKPHLQDGDFINHAMPALLSCVILLSGISLLFVVMDRRNSLSIARFLAAKPVLSRRLASLLMYCVLAGLIYTLREHLMAFFGVLSGVIMRKRVVSDVTGPVDSAAGLVWAAVLVGVFLIFLIRETLSHHADEPDYLRRILLMWPAAFLAILHFVASHTADRYYLIPQFIFLVALALVFDEIPLLWKRALGIFLFIGLVQGQFFFWSEAMKTDNRPPITFGFGPFYHDTSEHFLRLEQLTETLRNNGVCRIESSFFISEPLKFMQKSHATLCHAGRVAKIEYCDSCQTPAPWFEITYQ